MNEADVIVVDTGIDIIGVYSVTDRRFTAYRGGRIRDAIPRIRAASELVTYNGNERDLLDLARFAGLRSTAEFLTGGVHTDMREVCWSKDIWGSSLKSTYKHQFGDAPQFPDTYEGSCECDTFMTYKLWNAWKDGT